MKKRYCVFTGGGTGGHIYPAVAVASRLVNEDKSCVPVFVGAKRGIEKSIFPKLGFSYRLLTVGPLNRVSKQRKILSLLQLPFAILYSIFFLIFKKVQFVIGFGGYASAPMVIAAKLLGKKLYLWEGNATPGMVTRKVIEGAEKVYLAFPSEHPVFQSSKAEVIGVPTRFETSLQSKEKILNGKAKVLVFGGSQGALAINQQIVKCFSESPELLERFEIVHQVGRDKINDIPEDLKAMRNYKAFEFLDNIDEYYQWADFAICRAGASTIAELNQQSLPAILVPLPTAADDHQLKNAKWMESQGAGLVLEQKELSPESLKKALDLFSDADRLMEMSKNSGRIAHQNASQKILNDLQAVL